MEVDLGKHTNQGTMLIDEEDYLFLLTINRIPHRTKTGYAIISNYPVKSKHKFIHRLIMERYVGRNLTDKEDIDHISGDKLDNRKENLRIVDHRTNAQNRKEHRKGKLCGCWFRKNRNKWIAEAQVRGIKHIIGSYNTEQEAHEAYLLFLNNI